MAPLTWFAMLFEYCFMFSSNDVSARSGSASSRFSLSRERSETLLGSSRARPSSFFLYTVTSTWMPAKKRIFPVSSLTGASVNMFQKGFPCLV